jgi:hypothetical protein
LCGPVLERLGEQFHALAHRRVGLARIHLVGPGAVFEALDHVGGQQRPDHAEGERHVDVEAAARCRPLVRIALVDQEHPERLQPDVPERQLVALVILAEPAGAARAGGDIDIVVDHLVGADALAFPAQEIGEVSGGEAGRAALSDIGQLAAGRQVLRVATGSGRAR